MQDRLFLRRQIPLGLLRNDGQGVDGLARSDEISARLSALFVNQPKLHEGGHVNGGHELLEVHLEVLHAAAAATGIKLLLETIIERLSASIVRSRLGCLLLGGRKGRLLRFGLGRERHRNHVVSRRFGSGRGSCGLLFLLFRLYGSVGADFAIKVEFAPVGYHELCLFFSVFCHRLLLNS